MSGAEQLARARVLTNYTEIKTAWLIDCGDLQAKMSITGNFGGSSSVERAHQAFQRRAQTGVDELLAELANGLRVRGRVWHRVHEFAIERIPDYFSDILPVTEELMYRGQSTSGMGETWHKWLMTDLESRIQTHQAGWSAPKPETWPERHPVLFPVLMLLFGIVLGLASDQIKNRIFGEPASEPLEITGN